MKCSSLFESALAMLGEAGGAAGNADYASRAPYILAAACGEAAALDVIYRSLFDLDDQPEFSRLCIALTDDFPLSDRFCDAVVFYLAAMLAVDESEELYEKFFDKFSDGISRICGELPCKCEGIKDVYGLT